MNIWIENIIRFVVVFLLQVFLLNNLQFLGICHPCLYLLILFALPVQLPRWVELLLGFAVGLLFDVFGNTLGVHMTACGLIAYLRPLFINNMTQDSERLMGTMSSRLIGRANYLKIVIILTLLHHAVLFTVLAWSWADWWITLLEILASALLTLALIIGYDFIKG